jgi:hypothetical protein
MSGAICDGILSQRTTVWFCPHRDCRRRRRTTISERYDSSILKCSVGHEWITGDPEGLHYAGKHPARGAA